MVGETNRLSYRNGKLYAILVTAVPSGEVSSERKIVRQEGVRRGVRSRREDKGPKLILMDEPFLGKISSLGTTRSFMRSHKQGQEGAASRGQRDAAQRSNADVTLERRRQERNFDKFPRG